MDPWAPRSSEVRARYRVELLANAVLTRSGVEHLREGVVDELPWHRVAGAIAAEIGEPEGVRTIVFDLLVDFDDGFCIARFDRDPGEDAMEAARYLGDVLGPKADAASIKGVAADGVANRWYPDLESFECDALRTLESSSRR